MTRRDKILKALLDSFSPEFGVESETEFGVEGVYDFAALADDIDKAIDAPDADT